MKDSFKRRDETLPPKLQCGEKDRGHQRTQSSNHFLLFILFDIKSLSTLKLPMVKDPTDLVLSFDFNLLVCFIS